MQTHLHAITQTGRNNVLRHSNDSDRENIVSNYKVPLKNVVRTQTFALPSFDMTYGSVDISTLRDYHVAMAQMFCGTKEIMKVLKKPTQRNNF